MGRMRAGAGRIALALAVALLGGACAAATSSAPALVIGAIYPISGPQAPGGRDELAGLQVALLLAERTNALGDRRIDLRVVDVETPEAARAAVDRLIDGDRATMIVGTYGSTLADAAAARADERHVVYWETGAVADSITANHPYVFRTVATGSTLGRTAVEFTRQVLIPAAGIQPDAARAVVVYVDDTYGRSVAAGEVQRAAQLGIAVTDRIAYDPHGYDAKAIVARLSAARADYLWDVSYLDDGVAIWKQVVDSKVHLRAAVGTSSAFCMPAFGQRLGRDAVGVYAADKPDDAVNPAALTPEARSLLGQAKAIFATENQGRAMSIPAVAGFVGGWTLFHDVFPRIRGSVSGGAIQSAALGIDLPMGTSINGGGVLFAPSSSVDPGQNRRAASVVGQWQDVEQMKVVYPGAYADALPIIPK